MSIVVALFQQNNQVQNARWSFGHDYQRLLGLDSTDPGVGRDLIVNCFYTEGLELVARCALALTFVCEMSEIIRRHALFFCP